eukprot:2587419-Alexandrium_andersonii.AAC.1
MAGVARIMRGGGGEGSTLLRTSPHARASLRTCPTPACHQYAPITLRPEEAARWPSCRPSLSTLRPWSAP